MKKTTILSMTTERAIEILKNIGASNVSNECDIDVSSAIMMAIKALRETDAKLVVKTTDKAFRRGLKEGRQSLTWIDIETILKIASRRLCKPWLKSESKQALQEIVNEFYDENK